MSSSRIATVRGKRLPSEPAWLAKAKDHAAEYLVRFALNPGVEKVAQEFDTHFTSIKDPNERLDYLKKLANKHWDFRKGRERFEITEKYSLDEPDSASGKRIYQGACQAEMGSSSKATLSRYSIIAVLGGANMSNYFRLKYALAQHATCNMLAFLGSERQIHPQEAKIAEKYAPGARTEFDLGKGAILTLMGKELSNEGIFDVYTSEWHIARMQRKDGLPIYMLSAPPYIGGNRANTADTYDFIRRLEQEALRPTKNILFATSGIYRYAQYFDAVRELTLRTGVDVEVIGFEAAYIGNTFKPTQFLQELQSASLAAVRLRDTLHNHTLDHEHAKHYYRF